MRLSESAPSESATWWEREETPVAPPPASAPVRRAAKTEQAEFWFVGARAEPAVAAPAFVPVVAQPEKSQPTSPGAPLGRRETSRPSGGGRLPLSAPREGMALKVRIPVAGVGESTYAQRMPRRQINGLGRSLQLAGALDPARRMSTRYDIPGSRLGAAVRLWGASLFGSRLMHLVRLPSRDSTSHGPPRAGGRLA
jgi:hypothetical protein